MSVSAKKWLKKFTKLQKLSQKTESKIREYAGPRTVNRERVRVYCIIRYSIISCHEKLYCSAQELHTIYKQRQTTTKNKATPWLLQPHQGNMSRSWLRDTDSQNGDALLCIYYINFMYSKK